MDRKAKQSKTKVNEKALAPEPNHNKDESADLITPVVSPDDSQDLGAKASQHVKKVANPFPNMGDAKKIKSPSLETVKKSVEEALEFDMSDELKTIFSESELELSDEFYSKLSNILEAAFTTKVRKFQEELEESYQSALEVELANIKEGLEEKIDSTLSSVCEEWQEENKLAIEYGIRNEISESFMLNLKGLFENHYIEVPDSKVDLVEDLETKLGDLKEDFSKLYEDNVTLKENLDLSNKRLILQRESVNLSEIDRERFISLAENFSEMDVDAFESKLTTIKESYFSEEPSSYLTEDLQETENLTEDYVDPIIANIADRLI